MKWEGKYDKEEMIYMEKVTFGRDAMSKFAELNDDVLFGEVWSREEQLSPQRSQPNYYIGFNGQWYFKFFPTLSYQESEDEWCNRGSTDTTGFFAGWPKAWAALRMAKEVYEQE